MKSIRAIRAPWSNSIEIQVQEIGPGREVVAVGVAIQMEKPRAGVAYNSTASISYDDAQVLMDDLWAAGLRPSEGAGSAGAMAATQKHLDDMRELAFALLGKGKKP